MQSVMRSPEGCADKMRSYWHTKPLCFALIFLSLVNVSVKSINLPSPSIHLIRYIFLLLICIHDIGSVCLFFDRRGSMNRALHEIRHLVNGIVNRANKIK